MSLSSQSKLALAMTSAGSQRKLAAILGVSHQKVGRWLREGEENGAKQIPREAIQAIDDVFKIHKEVTRDQARVDGIPFNATLPVFTRRAYYFSRVKNKMIQGDRVIADHTEFLNPGLRKQFITNQQQTQKFMAVTVRSHINLYAYTKSSPRDSDITRMSKVRNDSLREGMRARERGLRSGDNRAAPIYTPLENIMPGTSPALSLRGIEKRLSEKHYPHRDGGTIADQILFQTVYQPPIPTNAKRKKTAVRGEKGTPTRTGKTRAKRV